MFNTASLIKFLTDFSWLGSWLFFVLAFLESLPLVGLVVPGATIIALGGFFASQGYLDIWTIIIAATIGAFIGDGLNYWGGLQSRRFWGSNNRQVTGQAAFATGEKIFHHYGAASLFLGRFLGPLKQIIPFIAGLSRMPLRRFIFWDALSIVSWAAGYGLLGFFFGTLYGSILERWADNLLIIFLVIMAAGLIFWLVKKIQQAVSARFQVKNLGMVSRFSRFSWFCWLAKHFPSWPRFLERYENEIECVIGTALIIIFLIIVYFLFIFW